MLEASAAQRRPASSAIGVVALAIAWQAWLQIRRAAHRVGSHGGARRSLASARHRRSSTIVVAVAFLTALTANMNGVLPGASLRGGAGAPANVLAPASDLTVATSVRAVVGGRLAGGPLAGGPRVMATPFISGPYLADGTLLKPVLVRESIRGATAGSIRVYTVRSGDTLTGIAARFGVSMMTLWWANTLTSKDVLHVGQQLRIPPVSGVLYTVREGDTLDAIATLTHAEVTDIREFNGLTSDSLIIGQVLMIPGGVGAPLPTPLPTPVPTPRPTAGPTAPSTATPAQPIATMTGVASWMSIDGLAARLATGTLVRVCGAGGCIERRVTTWGPADTSRIVDLYSADFTIVCGCELWVGLTEVRVDILPG